MLSALFGNANDRQLKKFSATVSAIGQCEAKYAALSDEDLRYQTTAFREQIANGAPLDSLLIEAFAVVREAAQRSIGLRPFDEQLIGGIVLHQGNIAEMKTGEGKTLVATLPSYLNALGGKGVHIVTVNEYLTKRDAEWMGQVYAALGLTTGCIYASMGEAERKDAYAADITYGTNNEFGFDHLRDGLKLDAESLVQRGFHYAIVDEVDSILVDEARTPLIISGPVDRDANIYRTIDSIARQLDETHFESEEKHKQITLTDPGLEQVEQHAKDIGLLKEGGLYDLGNISIVHMVQTSLRAHRLYHESAQYVVHPETQQVVIIDEFTGRMLSGRRYGDGLHQAIEAKHGLTIQQENQTLASITLQNLFRQYDKLAGMTGTAATEASEFHEIYQLEVVQVPTHQKMIRSDEEDTIYRRSEQRDAAVIKEISAAREKGQPVLVGTVTIEKSERLSTLLRQQAIPHKVLNARHHEAEADIIAEAGRSGAVTIATNMAGRGTDIKLGGTLHGRLKQRPNLSVEQIEADILEEERAVLAAGGLYIIGTERHESRRVDNQLRGRSGRQGDPGRAKFFISLDDDLMRIFGSERLDGMLAKLGLKEDEALVHSWISRAIEKAQQKVEAQHFEVRKQLLKFDDVVNDQRKVIFAERRQIMEDDDPVQHVAEMTAEATDEALAANIPDHGGVDAWDSDGMHLFVNGQLGIADAEWRPLVDEAITDPSRASGAPTRETIKEILLAAYDKHRAVRIGGLDPTLENHLMRTVMLQILDQCWKEHLLNLDQLRQGIGLRAYGQRDPLNEFKEESYSLFETLLDGFRDRVVRTVSHVYVDQEAMAARAEQLYQPTQAQALQYSSPASTNQAATSSTSPKKSVRGSTRQRSASRPASGQATAGSTTPEGKDSIGQRLKPRVARNAACPCGSGKKYKHCHGQLNTA
ncbi:MAG: preprotein translocase subunit SecA [Alphaproteobacteria bacterium]|nr:preprotein translocase subunit SecA [Alphaproteobacteria bacterium]